MMKRTFVILTFLSIVSASAMACQISEESDSGCNNFERWWTINEKSAWKSVCKGELQTSSERDDVHSESDEKKVVLSGEFIESLFRLSPYREIISHSPIMLHHVLVTSPLRLNAIDAKGLSITDSTFESFVDLSDSEFSGTLQFAGSDFRRGICARRVRVAGSIIIGGTDQDELHGDKMARHRVAIGLVGTECSSPVGSWPSIDATAASIDGSFYVRGAMLDGTLTLAYSHIGGMLDLEVLAGHEVWLDVANVGGQVVIVDSSFTATGARPGGSDSELLSLFELHTPKSVFLNRSTFSGTVSAEESDIGGSLYLIGATLGSVSLKNAVIGEELGIGINEHKGMDRYVTQWWPHSTIDMSHAKINEIAAPRNFALWPKHVIFTDFEVRSYISDFKVGGLTELSTNDWFPGLLALSGDDAYSPQPYQQVMTALINAGDPDAAAEVGFAGKRQERKMACRRPVSLDCAYLWFSELTVGYGYKMGRALLWALGLTVLGSTIFSVTEESRKYRMPIGITYSFDMLLPVIRLRDLNYQIDIRGVARYYFYFHKLAGWMLGIFIVAAISGITK